MPAFKLAFSRNISCPNIVGFPNRKPKWFWMEYSSFFFILDFSGLTARVVVVSHCFAFLEKVELFFSFLAEGKNCSRSICPVGFGSPAGHYSSSFLSNPFIAILNSCPQ